MVRRLFFIDSAKCFLITHLRLLKEKVIITIFKDTVKLLKRLAGLILFQVLKMRVLLEIGFFYLLNSKNNAGLIRIWVLSEGES